MMRGVIGPTGSSRSLVLSVLQVKKIPRRRILPFHDEHCGTPERNHRIQHQQNKASEWFHGGGFLYVFVGHSFYSLSFLGNRCSCSSDRK